MLTESAVAHLLRPKVAVLVIGQSMEQGPLGRTVEAAYPLAFKSAINPAVNVPLGSEVPNPDRGGWWPYVYDALYAWGYDLEIINAAISSMSVINHLTGFARTRADSTVYYGARTGQYPDRGDFGELIQFSSKTFRVTTGNPRSAIGVPPTPNPVNTTAYQDFMGFSGSLASAGSAPDVSGTAVGDTVTDGSLTLTRLSDTFFPVEGTFCPGPVAPGLNGGMPNYCLGGIMGERSVGAGFDPLGLFSRAWEMLSRSRAERKIVYFSQGQANLGLSATTYGRAVMIAMNYFLRRGIEVMIGNTSYSPLSSSASTTNYDAQVTGVATAITTLDGYYPGLVHAGANLYGSMGHTGIMGGSAFTGAIASNVLTVSASTSGAIEVGHIIANTSGTALGTVASLGTGTGGTGTYNLTGGVDTASSSMRSTGAFLQPADGIHLNGAGFVGPDVGGISCAGKYVADSFKAVLPQLVA